MLFRRLFLSFILLIVAVTTAVALVGADQLRQAELSAARESLRRDARLLELLTADDLRAGRIAAIDQRLRTLPDWRITIIAPDGRVLADSLADPAGMENHRDRAEVQEAAASGEGIHLRRSTTTREETLYVARRVGDAGFVRTAIPVSGISSRLTALYLGLAATAAVALIAAGVLSFAIVRRITEPVGELTTLAEGLAAGDLSRRSTLRESGELGTLTRALNQMADSLATMIAQASKDRESLRAMLASMAEGVIAIDHSQRILFANENAGRLLDIDAPSIVGRPLWEAVREEGILKAVESCRSRGESSTFQIAGIRGRTLDVSVAPSPGGIVIVAHDITETVRYQDLRKEFVANVSHELRTPLTMIKGFVETLQDGAASDPARCTEYLAIVEKHVNQLTNLVNDLLELSRLESRPGLPRSLQVSMLDVVRRVADLQRPAAAKKHQDLMVELPAELPAVVGDPDYLDRAVSNLVDNAIKYTPDGGWIRITAQGRDGLVDVSVADNGIGIPDADISRVFERFYRVDKSRSRDAGGTGLGLSIVKHVVQAHGGTIEVRSELGKGSVFRVSLPVMP